MLVNLLFTSVGRRVELLHIFNESYRNLGIQGRIIGTDIDPLAPALHLLDKFYLAPRSESASYVPTLVDICVREQVSVIFPLIDPDITILAAHKDALEATGARLAVVPLQAAMLTADKWLTYQFFSSIGVSVPRSWLPGQPAPDGVDYPLFIKPRKGSASQHSYRINNLRQLEYFSSENVPEPMISEYLPGPEITTDVCADLDGAIISLVSRQRLEVRAGEVSKGKTIYDEQIAATCLHIARALPAIGPITIQCIIKDGVAKFTEINARFGGGLPLGVSAGADSPGLLLARIAGLPVDAPSIGSYEVDRYMTRYDSSFFLSAAEVEHIRNSTF